MLFASVHFMNHALLTTALQSNKEGSREVMEMLASMSQNNHREARQ